MYTSLKFSKLLKDNGCELESETVYYPESGSLLGDESSMLIGKWNETMPANIAEKRYSVYSRYDILNDICVKYKDQFFIDRDKDFLSSGHHTCVILSMLQQNKPQEEIEKYIWDNCKFNPDNN